MVEKPDVLIIGGGVIGCACAYYLTQRGLSVTVIDKGQIGLGCSYGNAGWIVPCHALPLPMPGAVRQALQWLTRVDSPFYIKPRLRWDLARWLLRFFRFANARHLQYAAPVLVGLAQCSLQLFEDFAAAYGAADIHFKKSGLLYVCNSRSGLDHCQHELEIVKGLGVSGRPIDEAELRDMQPAITGPVVGGIHFEHEAHAEPLKVVQALAAVAQGQGATILPNTEVFSIQANGRSIESVRTTRGQLSADQYLFATGSWTPPLLQALQLHVPIQAGKGYALIVKPFSPPLTVPLMLAEKRVGVTPRESSVRLAGTLELAGLDESISERRVDAIVRGAAAYLDLPEQCDVIETWRGLRPCTPDGIPIIGRADQWENVLVAAGHAMLGLTMSMGTGRLVTDLITKQDPIIDPHPFRVGRFH